MYNFQTIRESISPKDIAMRYLGNPSRKSNGKNWYSSPFRRDSTPSFVADEKGFYDFGDNQYYDAIGLVSKIFNIHLKSAAALIVQDFNLINVKDSISYQEIENLRNKRKEQIEEKLKLENYYNKLENYLVDEIKISNREIYYLGKIFFEFNSLALNETKKIAYIDYLADRAFELEEYKENLSIVLSGINNCTKEKVYELFKENSFDYHTQIGIISKLFSDFADEDEVREYRNLGLQSNYNAEVETIEL